MKLFFTKAFTLVAVFYVSLGGLLMSRITPLFPNASGIESTPLTLGESNDQHSYGIPTQIEIPSLDVRMPVAVGTYSTKNDSWNISDNSAFFAQESASLMSDVGNTVLYAHNKQSLFGQLTRLRAGDAVIITDSNRKTAVFTLTSKSEVNPRDTSVFNSTDTYQLVLVTCSGYFDEKRMLFYFTPLRN